MDLAGAYRPDHGQPDRAGEGQADDRGDAQRTHAERGRTG